MYKKKIRDIDVLIVEDESIVAMDLRRRLISLGYSVSQTASSAKTCFQAIELTKPDIVLMDIILKGDLDGIETAQILMDKYNIPVVYLTAHSDENTLNRAKISEPYGYILKPFEVRDLKINIEIALYKFRIEAKLRESELNYKTLFSTAKDAIFTLGNDGLILSFNKKAVELFDFSSNELLGSHITKLIPDFTFIGSNLSEIDNELSESYINEFIGLKKGGAIFPVEVSSASWGVKSVIKHTLIIRDITIRKNAELIIRNSNLRLQSEVKTKTHELNAIIEQSPFGIRIFDKSGKLVFKNKAFDDLALLDLETFSAPENIFEENILIRYNYLNEIADLFNKGGQFETKPIYFDPKDYDVNNSDSSGVILIYRYYSLIDENNEVYSIVNYIENVTSKMLLDETNKTIADINKHTSLILETLEFERKRISQELHDSIGQMLFAIKYNIEAFEKVSNPNSTQITGIKKLLLDVNKELRNIINQLHPASLERYGLISSINKLVELASDSSKINIIFNNTIDSLVLDKYKEINIYRICQEALNNAIKHSKSMNITISTTMLNNSFNMIIEDDGIGFSVEGNPKDYTNLSYGLVGMYERANAIGASLNIESIIGKGTKINFEIFAEI